MPEQLLVDLWDVEWRREHEGKAQRGQRYRAGVAQSPQEPSLEVDAMLSVIAALCGNAAA
jgi:hypothetical protein